MIAGLNPTGINLLHLKLKIIYFIIGKFHPFNYHKGAPLVKNTRVREGGAHHNRDHYRWYKAEV